MILEQAMDIALEEANKALEEGEVPVGAVVLKDGELLSRAHNSREATGNISHHAEVLAIEEAERKVGRWQLDGCQLVVTLEPCTMCVGAIAQSRIGTLVYGADDDKFGAFSCNIDPFTRNIYPSPLIYRGIRREECQAILNQFFACLRK